MARAADVLTSQMTEQELERCRDYIRNVYWHFARTAARHNPHWYTMRRWNPEREPDFVWFAEFIRRVGYEETYNKKPYVVLSVDSRIFWTMGNPIYETTLINCKYADEGENRHYANREIQA